MRKLFFLHGTKRHCKRIEFQLVTEKLSESKFYPFPKVSEKIGTKE